MCDWLRNIFGSPYKSGEILMAAIPKSTYELRDNEIHYQEDKYGIVLVLKYKSNQNYFCKPLYYFLDDKLIPSRNQNKVILIWEKYLRQLTFQERKRYDV